jgi:hypothetical protein
VRVVWGPSIRLDAAHSVERLEPAGGAQAPLAASLFAGDVAEVVAIAATATGRSSPAGPPVRSGEC